MIAGSLAASADNAISSTSQVWTLAPSAAKRRAIAFERMQAKSGNIHILDHLRRIQGRQLHPQALAVTGLNAGNAAGLIESTQSLVPERLDHGAPGHKYLTDEGVDDALIELSFGDNPLG